MKSLAPLVIFAACHTAEPPPRAGAAPRPRLTGATFESVVDAMPPARRIALAFELVREGNLTCARITEFCGMRSIEHPLDDEGLAAPCLRRAVVQRALGNVGRIAIPADVLAILAQQDSELVETVTRTLDDKAIVDFLVAVETAGTPSPWGVLMGRPHDVVLDAARRHVDSAITELARDDREAVIAAIADKQIAPQTRADLLIGFDLPATPPLIAALESAAAEPDCTLSAHAADALAELGRKHLLPRAPTKHDPKAFFHQACRLTGGTFYDDGTALAATFVPKTGLVLVGPKGESFADEATPTRRTINPEDAELFPFLRSLVAATCDAKTCQGSSARYDLVWSGNVLARVTVHRDFAQEEVERVAAAACDPHIDGGGD